MQGVLDIAFYFGKGYTSTVSEARWPKTRHCQAPGVDYVIGPFTFFVKSRAKSYSNVIGSGISYISQTLLYISDISSTHMNKYITLLEVSLWERTSLTVPEIILKGGAI